MKGYPSSENELLDLISGILPKPSPDVITGIGDDCAVIRRTAMKGVLELLKTDALVEGIHYSPGTPLQSVGWKALCRPISDIAAMGGTPENALITVAAPAGWGSAEWLSLYRGLGKAARLFRISIVGGETTGSPGALFISVALTGTIHQKSLRLRSGLDLCDRKTRRIVQKRPSPPLPPPPCRGRLAGRSGRCECHDGFERWAWE